MHKNEENYLKLWLTWSKCLKINVWFGKVMDMVCRGKRIRKFDNFWIAQWKRYIWQNRRISRNLIDQYYFILDGQKYSAELTPCTDLAECPGPLSCQGRRCEKNRKQNAFINNSSFGLPFSVILQTPSPE